MERVGKGDGISHVQQRGNSKAVLTILAPDDRGTVYGAGQEFRLRRPVSWSYPVYRVDTVVMPMQRVRDATDVRAWLVYRDRVARSEADEAVVAPIGTMWHAIARTGDVTRCHRPSVVSARARSSDWRCELRQISRMRNNASANRRYYEKE